MRFSLSQSLLLLALASLTPNSAAGQSAFAAADADGPAAPGEADAGASSADSDSGVPEGGVSAPPSYADGDMAPRAGAAAAPAQASTDDVPARDAGAPALEVTVRTSGVAEQLQRSAQAVQVVELDEARKSSADLAEVLARTAGVSVRRAGALGSDMRFSLAGLSDEQVRMFLDGVPLELAGYPFGLANVPVNLVERVEVYSGVVPIRFGADALGGAVQLVSRPAPPGAHGGASYQLGSYDTHRLTLAGSYAAPKSGLQVRAAGFADRTRNDYLINVEETDGEGQLTPAVVRRFHDAYRASGGNLTFGVTNRPWAQRLLARAFITEYRKDIQSDPFMVEPYGEAWQAAQTGGGTLSYRQTAGRLKLDWLAGYTFDRRRLSDMGRCIYDWYGRCVSERDDPGENVVDADPHDRVVRTHTGLVRGLVSAEIASGQTLSLTLAPTYAQREGEERAQRNADTPDTLNAEKRLLTFVAGLEHKLDALQGRLQTLLFVKEYTQVSRADEASNSSLVFSRDRNEYRFGGGAALRYAIAEELWSKASYEYATRLPNIDELYGNGAQIDQNLQLAPELSHNVNLTLGTQLGGAKAGRYRLEVTGFLRDADQLIYLVGGSFILRYANVASARSQGVQIETSLESPGRHLRLDANLTYQDFRNTSTTGPFAPFEGDRMTNRPYLFGTLAPRLAFAALFSERDSITFTWTTRYTAPFYRTWESIGSAGPKAEVPAQLSHWATLTYAIKSTGGATFSSSMELQNVTDARVYDFYGVQKPGRSAFFKMTAEL